MTTKIILTTLALALAACGGQPGDAGSPPPPPPPDKIEVQPSRVALAPGAAAQLTANFTPGGADTHVTWSATGGSVDATGYYTAPSFGGTFTVRAASVAKPAVYGEATAVVQSPVTVTIVPPGDAVACEDLPLQADVQCLMSCVQSVDWQVVTPGCGTITKLTPLTAKFHSTRGSGTCLIRATHYLYGDYAEALANVLPETIISAAVAPASAMMGLSGHVQYGATVTTSCGTFAAGS